MAKSLSKSVNKYEEQLASTDPIRHIVISGGGAKILTALGAIEALENQDIISGIDSIAGSSAGTIATILCCSGLSAVEIKKILGEKSFIDLLDPGGLTIKVPFSDVVIPIMKKGKKLDQLIIDSISQGMQKSLHQPNLLEHAKKRNVELTKKKDELTNLEHFLSAELNNTPKTQIDNTLLVMLNKIQFELATIRRQQKDITEIITSKGAPLKSLSEIIENKRDIKFKHLGYLNSMWPERYKEPFITTVDKKTGSLIVSGFHTPNDSIAKTVHASAALPVVLTPVDVNGAKRVDGGFKDNITIDVFYNQYDALGKKIQQPNILDISNNPEEIAKAKRDRTIILTYGINNEGDLGYKAIHTMKKFDRETWKGWLIMHTYKFIAGIGGKLSYHKDRNTFYGRLREESQHSILLPTTGVGTIDFKKAQLKQEHMMEAAKIATELHLTNNNLTNKPIISLHERDFLMRVYNRLPAKSQDKVLLDFIKEKNWEDKDSNQLLKQFTHLLNISDNFKQPKRSKEPNQIDLLLDELNKPSTPDVIKQKFYNLANKSNKKLSSQELVAHIFTKDDINKIRGFPSGNKYIVPQKKILRNRSTSI